jgi:hypothetical protein
MKRKEKSKTASEGMARVHPAGSWQLLLALGQFWKLAAGALCIDHAYGRSGCGPVIRAGS